MKIPDEVKKSVFALTLALSCAAGTGTDEVKKSALAGAWYPADAAELTASVDGMLNSAAGGAFSPVPLALILPHAGYRYSGKTAAAGYHAAKNARPDVIVILGPSHRASFHGCSVLPVDFYETPLGKIRVNGDTVKKLLTARHFVRIDRAHADEHSVEIHLPFIQRIFGDRMRSITILPILVGDIDGDEARDIAKIILGAIGGEKSPLFIASSDFTHYGPRFDYVPFTAPDAASLRDMIHTLDSGAIDFIFKKDLRGFSGYIDRTGATICGRNPIMIALALPVKNFSARLVSYGTSGDVTGDFGNSVSYASIALYGVIDNFLSEKISLSDEDKKFLLGLARRNIMAALENGGTAAADVNSVPAACREKAGVFVTLKIKERLRGCIGYVSAGKPLYLAVLDNSYNAAFRDPRFPPLEKREFGDIRIEISVMTGPEPVRADGEIAIGRDGLIIEKGSAKGLLLPQVAAEWGWDREEFLKNVCRKAGLGDDAWKDKDAVLYRFQAIVFGE